jgi:DNA-binding NarL/FixJ family response regulator
VIAHPSIRVLLADDHAIVRDGLRMLIAGEPGVDLVAETDNGSDAVRLAAEVAPDVAVVDISMPGGGAEAVERIRAEAPGVRVLVLTMHEDRAHLTRMLEAGADGYVVKHASHDELLRAIRAVAAGESYVDAGLAGTVLRPARTQDSVDAALSAREMDVLRRVAWGESNKAIAHELGISVRTVETYKARSAEKLGLRSRSEIVRYAVRQGWLSQR